MTIDFIVRKTIQMTLLYFQIIEFYSKTPTTIVKNVLLDVNHCFGKLISQTITTEAGLIINRWDI